MKDRIHLFDVRLPCRIGVPPEERAQRQEIVLDVSMETSLRLPALSEEVADTIDYAAVLDLIAKVVAGREWVLVETLAEAICAAVLAEFPADSVRILLRKPAALRERGTGAAGVEMERRR
ncbi:MAG: dihydroneopterin aldolase [Bryobacterales bacterium]|nr:dihydroneopterin aldolase [Bryobacterales bacterium]